MYLTYTAYDSQGKILRTGSCTADSFLAQAGDGELIKTGRGDRKTQNIVNGQVENKSADEIAVDLPPAKEVLKMEDCPAPITNKDYQSLLDRITVLESK